MFAIFSHSSSEMSYEVSKDTYGPKYCRVVFPMKLIRKVGKIFEAGSLFSAVQCLRFTNLLTRTKQ